MALASGAAVSRGSSDTHIDAPQLQLFVMGLFFIFGGITSLNDVIIPKLKELFTLNFTQAMLVQFCFFAAYAVIGIPGARLVKKIGYMRGAVAGLAVMMIGCLLFIPASQTATYGLFLGALFVLASGVVIVQVVANPLISLLGRPETAHSRLTFAQAFNSLGTTVFPYFGAILILGSLATVTADQLSGIELEAYRTAETAAIMNGYLGIAVALAIVAAAVWMFRNALPGEQHEASQGLAGFDLLKRRRFGFGALCIFLYVGAEVAIGSLIVNYLMQDHVMGLQEQAAGKLVAYYWLGALIGRLAGGFILRMFAPGRVLTTFALGAIALIALSAVSTGTVSGWALVAVGLCNSLMFPTIFSLGTEGAGEQAPQASGIMCTAIVGGAIVPFLFGTVADVSDNLRLALIVPVVCYLFIAFFGVWAAKRATHS